MGVTVVLLLIDWRFMCYNEGDIFRVCIAWREDTRKLKSLIGRKNCGMLCGQFSLGLVEREASRGRDLRLWDQKPSEVSSSRMVVNLFPPRPRSSFDIFQFVWSSPNLRSFL